MNRTKLKTYAPQARRDFIQAVTDRAAFYGLTEKKIEPITENGDVAIIGGRAFPRAIAAKRKALEERIAQYGFGQTMDAIAYTWFNRLVAIRYMELHGYLDQGYRVLSHSDALKSIPEILEQAEHLDLPGLDKHKVIELKLEGSKEAELYRILVLAQCNALHRTMPFLFEWIGDETELLLPENLLHTDSLIRKLVTAIDEEDWQEVEIIGWLYQFYIAERKDEVMARKSAVPTEDIPAVTQLFTPHWIVRYLVENSLGRLWLLNRPASRLREHMPYYIEGEAETDFLKITKPEDIRLLDPACGSGHMLTYAFDLLFRIYEEEGYVPNEIPALILKHNFYGLEICPRAAQLAELALVFKAREKSRRFFHPGTLVQPRILALQDIRFDEGELRDYIAALDLGALFNEPMLKLLHQFEEATTFGSLIQPCLDEQNITFARNAIEAKDLGGQLFFREIHAKVLRALNQAEMLCQRYHVVVANPPYMGGKQLNSAIKTFATDRYSDTKTDLFAMFIERSFSLALVHGYSGIVTMQSWMFLNSYTRLREIVLQEQTIIALTHMGNNVMGIAFGTAATVWVNHYSKNYAGRFCYVANEDIDQSGCPKTFPPDNERNRESNSSDLMFLVCADDLRKIRTNPIAYWVSPRVREVFEKSIPLAEIGEAALGMTSSDNDRFIRRWSEVSRAAIGLLCASHEEAVASQKKWFPYNKGGSFRKWYGNNEFVINWENNGAEVLSYAAEKYGSATKTIRNMPLFFKPCVTWSFVSSSQFGVRSSDPGFIFDVGGSSAFPGGEDRGFVAAFLCSALAPRFLKALNPTVNFQAGNIGALPIPATVLESLRVSCDRIVDQCVGIARDDWDSWETSWDFLDALLLREGTKRATLEASWKTWRDQCAAVIRRMQELETENNRLFINAYGLADELTPEVPEEQITLARADRRKDMAAFLSYAVGCMMGRYSLDKPGLILSDAGDTLKQYLVRVGKAIEQLSFTPDEDGIIPVLDREWFADDIVARTEAFLRATFGETALEENVSFIEESLGTDLRKYFLSEFYKNHLSNERAYGYKKRPIYWLFSSGKERAFQCLVYLHRYHEGTLARVRTEYVIPLQGKMAARIEQLASETQKASSTSQRKTLERERDKLLKHQTELRAFDEKLRHYADQRIKLDLDDGVKVNYGKFGDLLTEVKAVAGGTDED